jgi:hypothetical protein
MTHHLSTFVVAVVLLAGFVTATNLDHARQKNMTQFFNFEDVCPPDGYKKEV